MNFTIDEIARIVKGAVSNPGDAAPGVAGATPIVGASIDSRSVTHGELFVPIIAERDGHEFIASAASNGASATLASRSLGQSVSGLPVIQVDDTQSALTSLGRAAADRLHEQGAAVIGITGSVGKTSVKDLTFAALASLAAHASERSFNNELGVPLTLINAPDSTAVAIVEMGARGVGHIDDLCSIARPTIGVVTMVGEVHTSEFGTIENVAHAKGELLAALPATGTAIVNIESPFAAELRARTSASVVTYGAGGDYAASDVVLDDQLRPRFSAHTPDGICDVQLAVSGAHQVSNALASLAIAGAVGVSPEAAAAGIAESAVSQWRMEMHRTTLGALVINDAYNANLISVSAGLRALADTGAHRKIAVLGTMAELGDFHDEHHAQAAALASDLGIELIAFAEPAYGVPTIDTVSEAVDRLAGLTSEDAVLVKGSRVAGLEELASALLAD